MKHLLRLTTVLLLIVIFLVLTACGGDSSTEAGSDAGAAQQASPGDPAAGKELFAGTCGACHGPTGEGVQGLGKDMTTSEFIAGKSDAELLEFIKQGRDPSDPLNTTGVAMPPKGGNPALSDEDLRNVIAFIRTIQK